MNTRHLRPLARAALAVAMLASAAWLWSHLPNKMQSWAPIAVQGKVGERTEGRNLAATVHDVQLGRQIHFSNHGVPIEMSTSGVWLVVTLSYEPLLSTESPATVLVADGRSFESPLSGLSSSAPAGLTKRSVVAFEVPERPATAELLISNKTQGQWGTIMQAPLDSQIHVPLTVPGDVEESIDLNKAEDG